MNTLCSPFGRKIEHFILLHLAKTFRWTFIEISFQHFQLFFTACEPSHALPEPKTVEYFIRWLRCRNSLIWKMYISVSQYRCCYCCCCWEWNQFKNGALNKDRTELFISIDFHESVPKDWNLEEKTKILLKSNLFLNVAHSRPLIRLLLVSLSKRYQLTRNFCVKIFC